MKLSASIIIIFMRLGLGRAREETKNVARWTCKDELAYHLVVYSEFMPSCKCIEGSDGSFELLCSHSCERCNEDANICGLSTMTELIDADGYVTSFDECFNFTEGVYDQSMICLDNLYGFDLDTCRISVDGKDCDSCEFENKTCPGLDPTEYAYLVADCTNVDEIGYVVDECTHTDHDGIISSFFAVWDRLGACHVDGSLGFSENSTDSEVGESRTDDSCTEEAQWQEDLWPEFDRECHCTAASNNTSILNCTDGCETCDANETVCGIQSFAASLSSYVDYWYQSCFEYTKGPLEGNLVCFENLPNTTYATARSSFFLDTGACRLSVSGVDCESCVVEEKKCDGFSPHDFVLHADCTNNAIGLVVDECDGDTFHEVLDFIYNDGLGYYATPGRCDIVAQGDTPETSNAGVLGVFMPVVFGAFALVAFHD